MSRWSAQLVVDRTACDGRGLCAEIFPERIELDRWGFPIVDETELPVTQLEYTVRAVRSCPRQALHILERSC